MRIPTRPHHPLWVVGPILFSCSAGARPSCAAHGGEDIWASCGCRCLGIPRGRELREVLRSQCAPRGALADAGGDELRRARNLVDLPVLSGGHAVAHGDVCDEV